MKIIAAQTQEIPFIRQIVDETWPDAYGAILSQPQIAYMIALFYSNEALKKQMEEGHDFFIIMENDHPLGFIDIEKDYLNDAAKLHKIYVAPRAQGKGIGHLLLQQATDHAHPKKQIILNVNRYNKAYHFYKKHGFEVLREEDIDIGNGFFMNDFVMGKNL